jgi:hypothetical protein
VKRELQDMRKRIRACPGKVDAGFPKKDMRKRTRACPGKVDAGFPKKDMRKRKTPRIVRSRLSASWTLRSSDLRG